MIKLDKGLKVSGRTDQSTVFCRKDQTTYLIALYDELLVIGKQCIEIMIWQFSCHTPYQHETPISALGLIWVSRVDMGYDMKIAIS